MKKAVLLTAVLALTAGAAMAAAPSIMVGEPHDFSNPVSNTSQLCVFCHTPHQTTAAAGQDPLWNHTVQATGITYGVYSSSTMNHTPLEIGGPGNAPPNASPSFLCLSCHDGTVGVNSLYNDPNDVGADPTLAGGLAWDTDTNNMIDPTYAAYLGTDLTDDHPVNFVYDGAGEVAADGGLETVAAVNAAAPGLLRGGNEVHCSSCHDPHDWDGVDLVNAAFLRFNMADSELCVHCHAK